MVRASTIAEAPPGHALWNEEMFLPILMMQRVASNEAAMELRTTPRWDLRPASTAARTRSAGSMSTSRRRYLRQPPAGRDHRRLAGLPGLRRLERLGQYRKAIGSFYYLPQYMREQSQTVVE